MTDAPSAAVAVTFDFHQTLVACDPWFELEVRSLASAFLTWQGQSGGTIVDAELLRDADAAYRRLRDRVVADGREHAAEACLALVLDELELDIDRAIVEAGVDELMRGSLAAATPVDGAPALVAELVAAGVPLGVVSSAVHHPFLEWALDRFEMRLAFTTIVTSASAGYYKSRPEIFWRAADDLGVDPANVIHIGDSYRFDVEGAHRAGMRSVWLHPNLEAANESHEPALRLTSLDGAATKILTLLGIQPAPKVIHLSNASQ